MKKILAVVGCLAFVLAVAGSGMAGSEMGKKMEGNLSGEVIKISGEMVDVKDADGNVRSVHVDPKTTKKSGELKVGAKIGADVNKMGHANSIWLVEE